MTKDYSQICDNCDLNPTPQLPQTSPIVKDLYALMEKHYGDPSGFKKLTYQKEDFHNVVAAAKIIFGGIAARGIQCDAALKLDMNRNTIRRHCKDNPYLKPMKGSLFVITGFDAKTVKSKMALDTEPQKV